MHCPVILEQVDDDTVTTVFQQLTKQTQVLFVLVNLQLSEIRYIHSVLDLNLTSVT